MSDVLSSSLTKPMMLQLLTTPKDISGVCEDSDRPSSFVDWVMRTVVSESRGEQSFAGLT